MTDVGERLMKLLKSSDIKTIRGLSQKTGYSETAISNVLHGKSKPSYDFLLSCLDVFPHADANWLLTGKDPLEELRAERNYLRGKVSRYENKVKELVKLLSNRMNPQLPFPEYSRQKSAVFA